MPYFKTGILAAVFLHPRLQLLPWNCQWLGMGVVRLGWYPPHWRDSWGTSGSRSSGLHKHCLRPVFFKGVLKDRNSLWKFSICLSKHSRTSLHNHRQNTTKTSLYATISVFRWNSRGLSKCLNGHPRSNLLKKNCLRLIFLPAFTCPNMLARSLVSEIVLADEYSHAFCAVQGLNFNDTYFRHRTTVAAKRVFFKKEYQALFTEFQAPWSMSQNKLWLLRFQTHFRMSLIHAIHSFFLHFGFDIRVGSVLVFAKRVDRIPVTGLRSNIGSQLLVSAATSAVFDANLIGFETRKAKMIHISFIRNIFSAGMHQV